MAHADTTGGRSPPIIGVVGTTLFMLCTCSSASVSAASWGCEEANTRKGAAPCGTLNPALTVACPRNPPLGGQT